jgi:excisionase family DNA binding protein
VSQATALLTDIGGVAALLKISRRTAYRLDDAGQLPAPITLGKTKRWRVAELEAWLRADAPPRKSWTWSEAC